MIKTLILSFIITFNCHANFPWEGMYTQQIADQVSELKPVLDQMITSPYPNSNVEEILSQFPNDKVLIFGYGSLMNVPSAARTVSNEAISTMRPVVAFGLHRIFNYYNNGKIASPDQNNERTYLNIYLTGDNRDWVNGVVIEVGAQDLRNLIHREEGYDLIPVVIMNWEEVENQNPYPRFEIAYSFRASTEEREGILYISDTYLPIRRYLHAVQAGSAAFGDEFLEYFNENTRLANDQTTIKAWLSN